MRFAATFVLALALMACLSVEGQGQDYRPFTDKKGQQILAALLEISPDMRSIAIRREDGEEFTLVINLLSLDDQQFIKNWLRDRSAESSSSADFRLELSLDRKTVEIEKSQRGSMDLLKEMNTYEVIVKNLSREDLVGASLLYTVVWRDQVQFDVSNDGNPTFDLSDEDVEDRVQLHGSQMLDALSFNREFIFATEPFEMNTITLEDKEVYREDELIGVIVRVVASDGTVIAEEYTGGSAISNLTWEESLSLTSVSAE